MLFFAQIRGARSASPARTSAVGESVLLSRICNATKPVARLQRPETPSRQRYFGEAETDGRDRRARQSLEIGPNSPNFLLPIITRIVFNRAAAPFPSCASCWSPLSSL